MRRVILLLALLFAIASFFVLGLAFRMPCARPSAMADPKADRATSPAVEDTLERLREQQDASLTKIADLRSTISRLQGDLQKEGNLQKGSRGEPVRQLQAELKSLGFYTSTYITGEFDSITYDAVIRFQRAKGITPTGLVGPLTRAALNPGTVPVAVPAPAPVLVTTPVPAPASVSYRHTEDLSEGSRGDAVRQLQLKLKAIGYFTSTVTDYFGPITKAAVIRFQTANGINPIGVVGPKTRVALSQL